MMESAICVCVCARAASRIHLSEEAHTELGKFGGYEVECRGDIMVKVSLSNCVGGNL